MKLNGHDDGQSAINDDCQDFSDWALRDPMTVTVYHLQCPELDEISTRCLTERKCRNTGQQGVAFHAPVQRE